MMLQILCVMMMFLIGQSNNPLKMSMMILGMSAFLMLKINFSTGNVWFSTLFFLLFMGGIMMMFMIVSSLMPNTKPKKTKIPLLSIIFIFCIYLYMGVSSEETLIYAMKWNLAHKIFFPVLTIFMAAYFLILFEILNKSKMPMRSYMCQ